MEIKNAEFVTTIVDIKNLTKEYKNQVAFVGRSNAGKSTLINYLCNNSKLARTSKTPGLTKNINIFSVNNNSFYIVDLPGYGYHQAGKQDEERWSTLLESFLTQSEDLKCVFALMDLRVKPNDDDRQMLKFCNYYCIPFVVLATKADKTKKSEREKLATDLAHNIGLARANVIITSSVDKIGKNEILTKLEQFLD